MDPGATVSDPGSDLEKFVSTKKYMPSTMAALQAEVNDIRNEASAYGSLGNVPENMQANVRDQMYLVSETLPRCRSWDRKSRRRMRRS